MHLVALVAHPEHACCRFRITPFRTALERAGHSLELVSMPKRWWSRYRLFLRLRGANVIVQRFLLPRWQLGLLRRQVRRLIFDMDDAIFLRDSFSPKGLHDPARLRLFHAMVQACDAVVAGNAYLREEARRGAPAARVSIIPTCVEPALYPQVQHRRSGAEVRLVWTGSASTLQGLERARTIFDAIGRRAPGVRLKVVTDRPVELGSLPIEFCPWDKTREPADIATGDIGVTWIPDDLWSKGKCGLKTLQYMAAGLPVIANPVGVHPEMVRQGATGFLAETPEQWVEAVVRLASSPDLRNAMGRAGRRVVEAEYSVAHGATLWQDLLARLESRQARAG
jgi:glycosyltransferase involved in cell wall biosynthesis